MSEQATITHSPEIIQSVTALMEELRQMRDLVLYYENRILRKQIALDELLHTAQVRAECGPGIAPLSQGADSESAPLPQQGTARRVSVRKLVEQVLPDLNGSTFWYPEIKKALLARWPEHERQILRSVYPTVSYLAKAGVIRRVEGGYQNVTPAPTPTPA